jgi:hypothetical protein
VVVARPQEGHDSGQWLSSTLAVVHLFATIPSDHARALVFLALGSPPLPFTCHLFTAPSVTTVLLI